MKFGLVFSILIAVFLIGGSLWYRFGNVDYSTNGTLVALDPQYSAVELQEFTNLTPATSTEITSQSGEKLTNTQVIGRNLLAEYVTLAATGEASDKRVEAIANNYIENIPNILRPKILTILDLNVIPDSTAALKIYADQNLKLHQAFGKNIQTGSQGKSFGEEADLYEVMKIFSTEYLNLAHKLKDISVPQSVAGEHLNLVNLYLSTSNAAEVINQNEIDPATSFAGLITFKQNVDKQDLILDKIAKILTAHGI